MISEKNTKIAGVLLTAVIIISVIGLYLAYSLFSEGETAFYFNIFSDLPTTVNGLTALEEYPGYTGIQEELSLLEMGVPYTLILEISAMKERTTHEYTVIIDGEDLEQSYKFKLTPGEFKTIEHVFTPDENNKWSLDFRKKDERINNYMITENSFIGERITPAIIPEGDYIVSYGYSPIQFAMSGFGRILNMNMTIEELMQRPYIDEVNAFTEDKLVKKNTTSIRKIYIKSEELIVENMEYTENHVSKENEVKIYILKDGEPIMEKTLGFKYQIQ